MRGRLTLSRPADPLPALPSSPPPRSRATPPRRAARWRSGEMRVPRGGPGRVSRSVPQGREPGQPRPRGWSRCRFRAGTDTAPSPAVTGPPCPSRGRYSGGCLHLLTVEERPFNSHLRLSATSHCQQSLAFSNPILPRVLRSSACEQHLREVHDPLSETLFHTVLDGGRVSGCLPRPRVRRQEERRLKMPSKCPSPLCWMHFPRRLSGACRGAAHRVLLRVGFHGEAPGSAGSKGGKATAAVLTDNTSESCFWDTPWAKFG